MKKRAQLIVKAFVGVLVSVGIILAFVYVGFSRGSGEYYFKVRTAEEIALLGNTLCSLPGNAEINFPSDLSEFNIQVEDNVVYVYNPQYKKDNDPAIGKYPISKPNCVPNIFIGKPKKLIIKKEEQKIAFIDKNAKVT